MPIYIFTCERNHVCEFVVPYDTEESECPKCGKLAVRVGQELPARRDPAHGIQTTMKDSNGS